MKLSKSRMEEGDRSEEHLDRTEMEKQEDQETGNIQK